MIRRFGRMGILLVSVLTLVAVACGGGEEEGGGTISLGGKNANDHGSAEISGDELDVELDDFYFEPTVIRGDAGQQVTLKLENEGDAEHNFSLTEQGIDQDVESGEDAEVQVNLPDSGMLVFFCKYHQGQGMVGPLEVG